MPRVKLKSLIVRKKDAAAVIGNLIDSLRTPVGILDADGSHLLGADIEKPPNKYPVLVEDDVIGYAVGDHQAAAVADLITHLAAKEAEKKTLGGEVLNLYREINLIYNFSEKLAASLEVATVAKLALDEASQLISASGGIVLLLDDESGVLESAAISGDGYSPPEGMKRGEGLLGSIVETGNAEIINDVKEDPRFAKNGNDIRSLICAPMKVKDRIMGVIALVNSQLVSYTAGELKLLNTLAIQTATAIENALLYEKTVQEARERVAALRRVDKLKDEFLANTSHELRTPLNGIIGIAESLIDGATGPLPEKTRNNLSLIAASGKRLANLVNDILDFSKLKTYDLELRRKPLDIRVLTDLVIQFSRPLLTGKRIALHNNISDNLPAIDGDENRIQQILHNLLGNAIKFTESGEVSIFAKENKGLMEISVKDDGIGIPEEKFDSVFQSFEQVDASTAREYGGTGLGLSITKKLVELHGGAIWIESEVGKGSIFTFSIPISDGVAETLPSYDEKEYESLEEVARVVESEELDLPVTNGDFIAQNGSFRILVVDDEPVNQQVLANHLSFIDCQVIQALNGQQALNEIENGDQFDLVLLDIMMPRMSGYEVCQRIREKYLPNQLPVIMITAKNQVADLVEGFSAGANDYVAKPISKNELLARIKTHLNLFHINNAYGRFVPHEFLRSLGHDSILDVHLGDAVQNEMTVLFSDIRAYSALSETMTPQENFQFLNGYHRRIGPIISKHDGFVNQYYGDGIMALYVNSAENAVRAAVEMHKTLGDYNQERKVKDRREIGIGVGMNTGLLMLGIIGDGDRMDTGAVSDTVNTAARMEGLTKYYGAAIIISENTFSRLNNSNDFNYRFLGKVQVKGKLKAMPVYEILDGLPEKEMALKLKTKSAFKDGLTCYLEKDFVNAIVQFKQVIDQHPDDVAALRYLERAAKHMVNGVPEQWEGVEEMEGK